jgi:N-acetyl-anhydromuramyl-L-alanine amidase AmpD
VISSPNAAPRTGGRPVRLVVLHTAEGARTAAELGNFFANPANAVSSHVGIDDARVEQYVPYSMAAWTMLSANGIADQAELCGFAAWTRQQWLTHADMLRLAAYWIRERCTARGIPLVKLGPAEVAAGRAGVCGHLDWTLGMHEGTHTDPGASFPWDVVMGMAAHKEDDMEWTDKAIPDYAAGKNPPELLAADVTIGWLAKHAGDADAKLDLVIARLAAIEKKLGLA